MDKGGFDSNTFFSTIVTYMITDAEWLTGISYSKTKIVFTNNAELNFIFLGEQLSCEVSNVYFSL